MASITETLFTQTARNGGATVSLVDGTVATHTTGFYVGGAAPSELIEGVGTLSEFATAVTNITRKVQGLGYIGSWRDTQDGTPFGTVFIDAVDWIEDRSAALKVAAHRGEFAIWDIANGAEVRL